MKCLQDNYLVELLLVVAIVYISVIFSARRYYFWWRLFVRLSVNNFTQKVMTDFDEIFWKCWGRYKEQSIRFWKLSVECRPLSTFKGKMALLIF